MMETYKAFMMGEKNRGKEKMVFDWEKAARLCRDMNAKCARAGLHGDWEYTGGDILLDGLPVPQSETYVYLASTWAVPEIEIDGELFDCYRMKNELPGWDADTYWPEEAIRIINDKGRAVKVNPQ